LLSVTDSADKRRPQYKACCLGANQGQSHDFVLTENLSRRLGPNDVLCLNALVHYTEIHRPQDALKLKSITLYGLQPVKTYVGNVYAILVMCI
jgi:hypothetical protein